MTYFGFLALFLGIPLLIMALVTWRDQRPLPAEFKTWPAWQVIVGHILVAVTYTTPWDNYLVATNVWWYDPELVTGYTIGWVPIEEYTFFVLQTLLMGLVMVWLIKTVPVPPVFVPNSRLRWVSSAGVALLWLISTAVLLSGWLPGTYLTLILSWALIPVFIQCVFGADILWHYRALLTWGIIPATLYLGAADALAIFEGTWVISPEQTVNIYLGGVLPLEEFIFFAMTNILVVLGTTLVLSRHSHQRFFGNVKSEK